MALPIDPIAGISSVVSAVSRLADDPSTVTAPKADAAASAAMDRPTKVVLAFLFGSLDDAAMDRSRAEFKANMERLNSEPYQRFIAGPIDWKVVLAFMFGAMDDTQQERAIAEFKANMAQFEKPKWAERLNG